MPLSKLTQCVQNLARRSKVARGGKKDKSNSWKKIWGAGWRILGSFGHMRWRTRRSWVGAKKCLEEGREWYALRLLRLNLEHTDVRTLVSEYPCSSFLKKCQTGSPCPAMFPFLTTSLAPRESEAPLSFQAQHQTRLRLDHIQLRRYPYFVLLRSSRT